MCGIAGIVSNSLSKKTLNNRLKAMGQIQTHRGPDDRRHTVIPFQSGLIGFGFVRLSILDLKTGMQPITALADNSMIVCNGQIYNYIELKNLINNEIFTSKGDVEVALHLYRKLGISFLNLLNGMYAGAIYDPIKQKLILFRDRFGIKPLYYTEWNNNFIFASEIKSLFIGSERPKEINKKQIPTYFTYRYLPGEETMFAGIKSLPQGSILEYDLNNNLNNNRYKIQRYWNLKLDKENHNLSIKEAAKQLNELINDAVRIRLRADVDVGSFLSGGIDSSAVASIAAQNKPDINLFTIAFKEEPYNELSDVKKFLKTYSKRFASTQLKTLLCGKELLNNLPSLVKSLEEPICLGAILPTDQVCSLAANHVKTVLTGEGADEIFAGYRKFLIEVAAYNYPNCSLSRKKELLYLYPELQTYLIQRDLDPIKRYIQTERLFSTDEITNLLGIYENTDSYATLSNLNGREHPLNSMLAMESCFRLPNYVILRLDKLSMRHSLETRTPFLDYRIAEFAATLPVDFKINFDFSCKSISSDVTANYEKFILRYTCEKHAILDKETAWRRKQPFTIPINDWLSSPNSLPDFIQEILFGTMVKEHGILNPDVIKKLVSNRSSRKIEPSTLVSTSDRIFAVIIFSLWYQEFFKS